MSSKLLPRCNWPTLPKKYDNALKSAVAYVLDNFQVLGIIATGTIIRGEYDSASDLDIYVLHQAPFRQRLQKFFNDVPAEIFVNPPKAVEVYLAEEQKARRPVTAHMLATGFVILKLDPIIDELQTKAKEYLSNPPAPPADLTPHRYLAALLLEDAVDKKDQDPETAVMILNKAFEAMLNYCFIQAGSFIPRQKSLLNELSQKNPKIAQLARQFYRSHTLNEKMVVAREIADKTIEARAFFEWESSREEYS